MKLISSTVAKFLNEKFEPSARDDKQEEIKFFFQNQMTSNYKMDERILKELFNKHVSPASENDKIGLHIYYRTKKLSNLIIKNRVWQNTNQDLRNHVVYQYLCDKAECNFSTYIGYTTCSLFERFKMHTQTGSIIKHLKEKHKISKVPRRDLLDNTTVLTHDKDKRKLVILEALLIKEKRPSLNSQAEGSDSILKIFIH